MKGITVRNVHPSTEGDEPMVTICARVAGSEGSAVGAIRGLAVKPRDVTDRHRLERTLVHAQKMQAVGQLVGGVAHDFNNLLTAVIGFADHLSEQQELSEESYEFVAEIRKAARGAATLTRQHLAFSRKQILQQVSMDLDELVRLRSSSTLSSRTREWERARAWVLPWYMGS
jgi:signal transduction histidine kinase